MSRQDIGGVTTKTAAVFGRGGPNATAPYKLSVTSVTTSVVTCSAVRVLADQRFEITYAPNSDAYGTSTHPANKINSNRERLWRPAQTIRRTEPN